ncbi:hypothetical protein [Demequina sp. NBRC 110054]|uniref:hypothetical protein n=1 Tax=Demequina sp. NBRC 110054 TaxID=1570343 RepID=UPI000A04CCC5|nr:hypothetical protein [Demequina sp. NBRC 110054]
MTTARVAIGPSVPHSTVLAAVFNTIGYTVLIVEAPVRGARAAGRLAGRAVSAPAAWLFEASTSRLDARQSRKIRHIAGTGV